MSGMNIGKRQLIKDATGKVIGSFLPSKKYPGKIALTKFLSGTDVHVSIKGYQDWIKVLEVNPDWSFVPSFYTVGCEKEGNEVVISMTHNEVDEWSCVYRVEHTVDWQEKFLLDFRLIQTNLNRETHIGNFPDLAV
jgi:hypothetical protein